MMQAVYNYIILLYFEKKIKTNARINKKVKDV